MNEKTEEYLVKVTLESNAVIRFFVISYTKDDYNQLVQRFKSPPSREAVVCVEGYDKPHDLGRINSPATYIIPKNRIAFSVVKVYKEERK